MSALRSMQTTHKSMLVLRCKVVVVGDACVGKSALTQMFYSSGHNYPKNYVMTVNAEFCMKSIPIQDTNAIVELYLFDCGGQSIFNQRDLGTRHYDNASKVILVYDITNRESFQSCAKWLQEVRSKRPSNPIGGILVANKQDIQETCRVAVRREEGEEFAEQHNLQFIETSAQNGSNVDQTFQSIAHAFYNEYEKNMEKVEKVH